MINHLVNQCYEVLEKIGESPLFTVYKARDKAMNRMVALKTVSPPYATEPAFMEAFNAGLKETILLNHPHIVRFYETGTEGETPYAIIEFVRGINLKERIRRIAPFTLSAAVDFGCAIAEALHYAHTVGQTHGDLRPHNIIISPEGILKVTDFGLTQAIANSPQAQKEILLRSAPYHAPELSTKQTGTVGGDIYALGAVLYEMLTGAPLYNGDSLDAVADLHAFGAIPSPRTLNPGVPRSMEGIILKCLQKRPENRYRTAAELLTDLKSVRDALRFGKPLSWSPIDMEKLATEATPPTPAQTTPTVSLPLPIPSRPLEPVAEVAASSVATMPKNNRLRAQNERVSIYIKAAIAAVTALILVCLIVLVGIWITQWAVPKSVSSPHMEGKTIDEVRTLAASLKVKLNEHGEYSERPKDMVYKTDLERGVALRANHTINVWYSKGPAYVQVPRVTGLSRTEAEKRLQEAGLKVGEVLTGFSDTIPTNYVISQNVSFKKRVFHDTLVGLVISDGPKPDFAAPESGNPPPTTPNDGNSPNGDTEPNRDTTGNDTPSPQDGGGQDITLESENTFDRSITIPRDGKGSRRVKVVYRDKQGWHDLVPVIDEMHTEGESIPITFTYYGKQITLRIYYDDKQVKELTFDPQATRDRTVR